MFVPARQSSRRGHGLPVRRGGGLSGPAQPWAGRADPSLPPRHSQTPHHTMAGICSGDAISGALRLTSRASWPSWAALRGAARLSVRHAVQTCSLQLILHNGLRIPKLCISPSQHHVFFTGLIIFHCSAFSNSHLN